MGNFTLDPRLAADSMPLGALSLCELRLMNDSRWPWLLLVPMRADAVEMHDLACSRPGNACARDGALPPRR